MIPLKSVAAIIIAATRNEKNHRRQLPRVSQDGSEKPREQRESRKTRWILYTASRYYTTAYIREGPSVRDDDAGRRRSRGEAGASGGRERARDSETAVCVSSSVYIYIPIYTRMPPSSSSRGNKRRVRSYMARASSRFPPYTVIIPKEAAAAVEEPYAHTLGE